MKKVIVASLLIFGSLGMYANMSQSTTKTCEGTEKSCCKKKKKKCSKEDKDKKSCENKDKAKSCDKDKKATEQPAENK